MGNRSRTAEVISSLLSFAAVVRATAKATLHILEHADDGDGDESEYYGDAALTSRPPAGADALFIDLDGERVVFGTRETRWTVAMDEGDAVLRALGADTRAYVRLKKNGDVEVNGARIYLGDSSAANFVALANLVNTQLNTLKAAIAGAAVTPLDGGAAFKAALVLALSAWPGSVASTRVRSL